MNWKRLLSGYQVWSISMQSKSQIEIDTVALRGPIVMNTQAELELAFREYREGTFIKHK